MTSESIEPLRRQQSTRQSWTRPIAQRGDEPGAMENDDGEDNNIEILSDQTETIERSYTPWYIVSAERCFLDYESSLDDERPRRVQFKSLALEMCWGREEAWKVVKTCLRCWQKGQTHLMRMRDTRVLRWRRQSDKWSSIGTDDLEEHMNIQITGIYPIITESILFWDLFTSRSIES
jgi:hypothetical protein